MLQLLVRDYFCFLIFMFHYFFGSVSTMLPNPPPRASTISNQTTSATTTSSTTTTTTTTNLSSYAALAGGRRAYVYLFIEIIFEKIIINSRRVTACDVLLRDCQAEIRYVKQHGRETAGTDQLLARLNSVAQHVEQVKFFLLFWFVLFFFLKKKKKS